MAKKAGGKPKKHSLIKSDSVKTKFNFNFQKEHFDSATFEMERQKKQRLEQELKEAKEKCREVKEDLRDNE